MLGVRVIRELPQLPRREPVCPAAEKVTGATTFDGGCVCRAMLDDQQAESGVGMNPRQLEVAREGTGGVYLTVKSDPQTVSRFCFGRAVPVVTGADGQKRESYTYCPVWQQRRERDLAAKRAMFDPVEPDGVSFGVEVQDPEVRHGPSRELDELAPQHARR